MKPKQLLKEISRAYPQAWQQVKEFRAGKGKDLPDWPDWCYIPLAVGVAIATQGDDSDLYRAALAKINPSLITAAAAWRITQGVYRFDPDLYNELVNQPMDGNLPCDVLKRLPEWCVYIELLPSTLSDGSVVGFFAHLEKDMGDGREELRFVTVHNDGKCIPIPLHLGDWTIKDGLQMMVDETKRVAGLTGLDLSASVNDVEYVRPLLQLVLYLCADDIDMPRIPQHPKYRVRMSGQADVAREIKSWTVGERIGSAIRRHRNQEAQEPAESTGIHERPRPHIRRAHWHSFWKGPRDGERQLVVHWLPPIPINVDENELPTVIHPVKQRAL